MGISDYVANLAEGHKQAVSITVFVAILCLCLVIGHLLEENRWVNESITAILIGCVAGTIILLISKGRSSHILRFNEELFFIYLLPPIICNAGFQVKKKQFFHNFFTIMLFGVVGVFISCAISSTGLFPKFGFVGLTAKDYLAIGTIFLSTDTVCTLQVLHQEETPLLYSLVFGEGVVNDAKSVVLFNAIQKLDISRLQGWAAIHVLIDFLYLFSTSMVLGVAVSRSSDRIYTQGVILWQLFGLCGILTVFFAGILMSHHAWHNVTEGSKITTRHMFATMSFVAESFIFLYVGMDALDIEKWKLSKLSVWTLLLICGTTMLLVLLGRTAFVFPLSAFANYTNHRCASSSTITLKHQVIIWWAGLIRGAVSTALAFKLFTHSGVTWDQVNATMITTTVVVVLFITIVFGFPTKPLVSCLLPPHVNY